jgi:hypothetical protein
VGSNSAVALIEFADLEFFVETRTVPEHIASVLKKSNHSCSQNNNHQRYQLPRNAYCENAFANSRFSPGYPE